MVILTDDMRWDELENMPNVSSLLATGDVTFAQPFVSNSLCCPSRATLLTGQFSSRTGVWTNAYSQASPYGGFKSFKPPRGQHIGCLAAQCRLSHGSCGQIPEPVHGHRRKDRDRSDRPPAPARLGLLARVHQYTCVLQLHLGRSGSSRQKELAKALDGLLTFAAMGRQLNRSKEYVRVMVNRGILPTVNSVFGRLVVIDEVPMERFPDATQEAAS